MADKNVSVRLVATGGGQVRAELVQIGEAGDAAFAKVGTAANSAGGKLKTVGTAAEVAGRGMGAMGGGLRQTTQQLSQVAQAGAATGQWVQALAIQIPDLALAFGPVGIAIGAVTGVLLTMAPALLGAGGAAKEMEEKLKAADKAADALSKTAKAVQQPMSELRRIYDESADEIARMTRNQLAFDRAEATRSLGNAMNAAGLSAGAFTKPVQGPDQPGMFDWLTAGRTVKEVQSEYDATLTRLIVKYQLSEENAIKLAAALERVSKASNADEAIQSAANLQDVMIAVSGSVEDADKKFGGENGLWESVKAGADIAKRMLEANAEAAGKLGKSFDEAASGAADLGAALRDLPGIGGTLGKIGDWVKNFRETKGAEFKAGSKGILDLIGWAEGTDKGRGYNETLGYGAFTGGPVNLTSMSLKEVQALQRRMLAHPSNTYNSSAVGRYQIVGSTMRRLMAQMGLSGDELFDESMQDRMAMELVRARAKQGTKAGWDAEWQSFKHKGISLATINAALGQKSIGVDPGVAATEKKRNDELERGLKLRSDFIEQMQQQVNAAAMEAQATGQSVYEQARLRAEMMLTQKATADGIALTDKIADSEKTYGQAIKEAAANIALSAQSQADLDAARQNTEEAARQSAEATQRIYDSLRSGVHSAFDSIVDGTKSVGEAFRNMLADILMQLAHAQLDKMISQAFGLLGGGGGDPLSAAFAGIFGGGIPSFAGGGWTGSGARAGGLDGQGGYLAMLHPRETVIDHARASVAAQTVRVTVGVDQKSGNLTAFTDQRVGAGMRQADRAMPSRVASINRDPLRR